MTSKLTSAQEKKIQEILTKEIDPIFFSIAAKIEIEVENPRYLPWLLAHKMTMDEARILDALPDTDRTDKMKDLEVSPQFIERLGLSKEKMDYYINELYRKGDISIYQGNGPLLTSPGSVWLDLQHNMEYFEIFGEEFYFIISLWADIERKPVIEAKIQERIDAGLLPRTRTIPRYDSVCDDPDLLPVENMKEILRSKKKIALQQCPCRLRFLALDSTKDSTLGVCMVADQYADWTIGFGGGKEISFEEAWEIMQEAGKRSPMVHISNYAEKIEDVGGVMCQCNVESCVVFRRPMVTGSKYHPWEFHGKSRYRARIDLNACIDCGICETKRCMFNAIRRQYDIEQGKEMYFVNEDLCMGCGCCVGTCPTKAMKMFVVDPPEIMKGKMPKKEKVKTIDTGAFNDGSV